jgi:hypothetical protein
MSICPQLLGSLGGGEKDKELIGENAKENGRLVRILPEPPFSVAIRRQSGFNCVQLCIE